VVVVIAGAAAAQMAPELYSCGDTVQKATETTAPIPRRLSIGSQPATAGA
jgi:hypothetical protein